MRIRLVSIIACSILAVLAQAQERKTSLTGTIQKIPDFQSATLSNARDLLIYLPPQYATEPKRRFPVVYMHDGQNVFDGATAFIPNQEWRADETAEMLIRANLIEPLIIVAIPNAGLERANEYLPTKSTMGKSTAGGKADKYTQMVAEEIKPLIDRTFRTKTDPMNTGVIGSSFGGIVTLHMGLTRPDVFGKIAVVSPSIWWDNRVMLKRVDDLTKKPNLKIWTDVGTAEGTDTVKDVDDLLAALVKKGWKSGRDVVEVVDFGAAHNEIAWAHRLPSMLMFLFPARA